MLRRITHLLTLLSLVLLIGIGGTWAAVAMRWNPRIGYRSEWVFGNVSASLVITYQTQLGPTRFPPPRITLYYWWWRVHLGLAGLSYDYGDFDDSSTLWRTLSVTIPPWAQLMTMILPATRALRFVHGRTHRQRHAGNCPVCGYDLRATPDRCPECGARSFTGTINRAEMVDEGAKI